VLLRLVLAAVLGGLIGLERGRLERAAGLRTHALVGLGSCLLMLVSTYGFGGVVGAPGVALDPSRVAAQVVSGIGFLGAGTIILRREIIKGLTTAASIWAVAAVGLAVGGGLYLAAAVATFLALVILAGLKPVEGLLYRHRRHRYLNLVVDRRAFSLYQLEAAIEQDGLQLEQILVLPGAADHQDRVCLQLNGQGKAVTALIDHLRTVPGVVSIEATPQAVQARLEAMAPGDEEA
jgi:putative Mg2+ transporter-C (MgtC) family protein